MTFNDIVDMAGTRFTTKAQQEDTKLKQNSIKYELSFYSGILAILIIICLLIFKNI